MMILRCKETKKSQNNLELEERFGGLTLPNFKTDYEAIALKTH